MRMEPGVAWPTKCTQPAFSAEASSYCEALLRYHVGKFRLDDQVCTIPRDLLVMEASHEVQERSAIRLPSLWQPRS